MNIKIKQRHDRFLNIRIPTDVKLWLQHIATINQTSVSAIILSFVEYFKPSSYNNTHGLEYSDSKQKKHCG